MSIWATVTGSDLTSQWKEFEARAAHLPADHRAAWEQIQINLLPYGDFSGRNLGPLADAALALLEEAAADGRAAREVLGDDIPGFCGELAGGRPARTYRDRWREQLNRNVATRLERLV